MFNFDYITKEDIKEHNPNWPQIHGHSQKILLVGGSWSGKTNAFLNLLSRQPVLIKLICMLKVYMKQNTNC